MTPQTKRTRFAHALVNLAKLPHQTLGKAKWAYLNPLHKFAVHLPSAGDQVAPAWQAVPLRG